MTSVANNSAADTPRDQDAVLADAIKVLTGAGRLRVPVLEQTAGGGPPTHSTGTQPADWAEFITLAVAGAAANIGGVEKALQGRPGSWEADSVRNMLMSTVGEDPAMLDQHRTEPLRLVFRPAEMLEDLGYDAVYDESQRVLQGEQARHVWTYQLTEGRLWQPLEDHAPAHTVPADEWLRAGTIFNVPRSHAHEQKYDRLLDLESRADDMRYDDDPKAYGEALRAAAEAKAAQLGIDVEVHVDLEAGSLPDDLYGFYGPEEMLLEELTRTTPLPWSGLTPRQYPSTATEIVNLERTAARLPHQRLEAETGG